jgi:hypothetical protein
MVHKRSEYAQKVHGLRAKLYHKKRHAEKIQMKKTYFAGFRSLLGSNNIKKKTKNTRMTPKFPKVQIEFN